MYFNMSIHINLYQCHRPNQHQLLYEIFSLIYHMNNDEFIQTFRIIDIRRIMKSLTSQHLSQTTPSLSTYLKQTSNRLYILFDNLDITLIRSTLSVYVIS